METYASAAGSGPFAASIGCFESLTGLLAGEQAAGWTCAQLEEELDARGRQLLRALMQDHLDLRAQVEAEAAQATKAVAVGTDGLVRRYREYGHPRWLAGLFGLVRVRRVAYRQKGLTNVHPADAVLSLPAGRHSAGLSRLAAIEAVRGSYDQALAAIERRCGHVLSKHTLEQLVQSAAVDIDDFYRHRAPVGCTAQTLLILEADAKGVPMRPEALRPTTRKAHQAEKAKRAGKSGPKTRRSPGQKPHRKRMATLAVVHDTEPAPRRAHDIIAPPEGRSGAHAPRPGPVAERTWLTGSITDPPEQVITAAFDQAQARDPGHHRPWLALVDGARHQLDLLQQHAADRGIDLHILLDFIHVAEYVWGAAHRFHPAGSQQAQTWAAGHLTTILHGQAARAAAEMTTEADQRHLPQSKRGGVNDCVRYLTGHLDQLHYDTALEAGWPIATGVIEGACRHLIGDRLSISGAHWGLPGAEAVLKLRALTDNGDFQPYWKFHLEREHQRLYPTADQHPYQLAA